MIRKFSATEKVTFAILVLILTASALTLAFRVNEKFMVHVPSHGGTLTEAEIGLPRLINPVIAVSDVDRDLSALIYAGLFKYDHGNLVADLAKNYTVSDDGLTYTVNLKDNIRFHDGSPVTADDVEFTIQKIQDPSIQSPRRVDWKDVTVNKISSTQLQFILNQPYAPFVNNLTVGIIPKHIWKNVDANQFIFSQYNIEPIGAGPYELDKISRDGGGVPTSYTLTPFSKYPGGEPYIGTLSIRFFSDEKSALDNLRNGSVDSLAAVSSQEADKIATDNPNDIILNAPLPRIFGIFLNQNTILFTNKEVRQALDMSVDKDELVSEVLNGYGVRIDGPIPYGVLPNSSTTSPAIKAAMTPILKLKDATSTPLSEAALALLKKVVAVPTTNSKSSKTKVVSKPTTTASTTIATSTLSTSTNNQKDNTAASINISTTAVATSTLDASSSKAASLRPSAIAKENARQLLEKNGWIMGADGIYEKPAKKTVVKPAKGAVAPQEPTSTAETQRLEFSIATADSPDLKQTAEFVKNEWKQIGADVTIKVFESGDLTQDIIRNRKYDALLFGEVIGKDLDLYAFWHSSQRNAPGLNLSMYVNSKTDKLLEDARSTSDDRIRLEKYAEFDSAIRDDVPAVFLYSPSFIYVIPDKVRGASLNQVTAAWDRWNNVNTWYITTENVWKIFANKTALNK